MCKFRRFLTFSSSVHLISLLFLLPHLGVVVSSALHLRCVSLQTSDDSHALRALEFPVPQHCTPTIWSIARAGVACGVEGGARRQRSTLLCGGKGFINKQYPPRTSGPSRWDLRSCISRRPSVVFSLRDAPAPVYFGRHP